MEKLNVTKGQILIGIYKITNPIGQVYIGQSINILERFKYHQNPPKNKRSKLNISLERHGRHNHTFEIIEECSKEILDERERYWQDYYNVLESGLNSVLTKTKTLNFVLPENVKQKISNSLSGKNNPRYGKKLSKEQKQKISEYNKNPSLEKRLKISEAKSKIILDLYTGVFYNSLKELAELLNKKPCTMMYRIKKSNQYLITTNQQTN